MAPERMCAGACGYKVEEVRVNGVTSLYEVFADQKARG
jgi:hypothetical protein